ncbi:ARS binding protein 2-domain-containing protein [Lophiotrema nucula]|uniref:ARS binding protein 2-domain-containing protein n=1 Tax=Lophiotrema nucula TaxID=690887 RepID=A0A6A5ZJU5_9PLEO|nr:ARS binding protein 2-domain-containing protein [Lophiotrema nucula]
MQVDYGGAGPETEHNLHLSHHAHFDHQGNASPAFTPFRHPAVPAIDPGLDHSSGTRNGHAPMTSTHHHSSSQHLLTPDNAHLSHPFYGDMPRSTGTPSTPSNASPRFTAISPSGQPKQIAPGYVPTDRAPPSRDVSDHTIDDAYAAFILYCNPSFPASIDTSELTKLFRTPPKSDGKAFSTWTLYELIRKFDSKEIKTWTQLALDLGVQQPDIDKGQSTQKVQQYSVRLKRWMRAMHIDAFFEYLLGKQPPYYLHIPPLNNPFPETGRDGVPLEEDLAIRALDPKFRPKRGRRKAEDGDEDESLMDSTPPRKRPQLDTSIPFGNVLQPQSAYPNSAHPDHMDSFLGAHDAWTASAITPSSAMTAASAPSRMNPNKQLTPYSASPMSGQQLRWRLNTHENPATPHPLSAVTPQSAHPDFFDEPHSAITPSSSKPRSRRRHGPAVSSAWSGNNTSSTGKLRGRPPSNRSVRDGPFVTFPANPNKKEGPTIEMNRNPGNLTPIVERAQSDPPVPEQHFRFPPTPASAVSPTNMQASLPNSAGGSGRPHRLSLQVPENVGNPVRLVTPTVLVNGEQDPTPITGLAPSALSGDSARNSQGHFFDDLRSHANDPQNPVPSQTHPPPPQFQPSISPTTTPLPHIDPEALNRALATELIRAPLHGRRKRLRGTEAKTLASTILHPLYAKPASGSAPTKIMSDALLRIAIASCLGLAQTVGLGAGGPTGGVRRVECVRFRVGGDGYESPIDEDDEDAEGLDAASVRETFDVSFAMGFGGLTGEWCAKGLRATASAGDGDDVLESGGKSGGESTGKEQMPNTAQAWKSRFLEAQRRLWESQEEAKGLKERILEAVL